MELPPRPLQDAASGSERDSPAQVSVPPWVPWQSWQHPPALTALPWLTREASEREETAVRVSPAQMSQFGVKPSKLSTSSSCSWLEAEVLIIPCLSARAAQGPRTGSSQ